MIRWSDNAAATRVLGIVGARGVYGVATRARMRRFALDPSVWGRSRIDAADQTRFFLSHPYAITTLRGVFARLLRGL